MLKKLKEQKKITDVYPNWFIGCIMSDLMEYCNVPWKVDEEYTKLHLDTLYITHSGDKFVAPIVYKLLGDDDFLDTSKRIVIATMIYEKYKVNWKKLYDTLTFEYEPIYNYDVTEHEVIVEDEDGTKTGTVNVVDSYMRDVDSTSSSTNTDHSLDGVYGFNSNEAVNSDVTDSNVTDNGTNTERRTDSDDNTTTNNLANTMDKTTTRDWNRKGNIGVVSSQDLIVKERNLWLWNFFEQVFNDIDKEITLKVYYNEI